MWLNLMIMVMSMQELHNEMNQAIRLRNEGLCEAALKNLNKLIAIAPPTALLHYQTAWTHDRLGQEAEAIPHYERALDLGLNSDADIKGCLIGLGSSYRCVRRPEDSVKVLAQGIERFPNCPALKIFKAFSHFDLNDREHVERLLLSAHSIAEPGCTCLHDYRKAIATYAAEILHRQ